MNRHLSKSPLGKRTPQQNNNQHNSMLYSIVTVHFNDLTGLARTLASVRNQTFDDYEQIIIDGGTRNFHELTASIGIHEKCHVVSESDDGIYDAMNKGLSLAKGDYVIFLNAGDTFFDKEVLHKVSACINTRAQPDMIYGNTEEITTAGLRYIKLARSWKFAFWTTPTRQQSIFLKRQKIKHTLRKKYTVVADVGFVYEFIKNCGPDFKPVKMDTTISSFEQGGYSHKNDWLVAKEGWSLRREVMNYDPIRTFSIVAVHGLARIARRFSSSIMKYKRRRIS